MSQNTVTPADHLQRATQYARDADDAVTRALAYVRQGHIALAEDVLEDAVEAVSGVRYRLAEVVRENVGD